VRAAVRALIEEAYVPYVTNHARGFLAYCAGTWWQRSRVEWRPLPGDRYLLPHLKQWGEEFLAEVVDTDEYVDRRQWLWDLSADHRLLPICRQLRRTLGVDSLLIGTHPGL
jgi:hypothetical protein